MNNSGGKIAPDRERKNVALTYVLSKSLSWNFALVLLVVVVKKVSHTPIPSTPHTELSIPEGVKRENMSTYLYCRNRGKTTFRQVGAILKNTEPLSCQIPQSSKKPIKSDSNSTYWSSCISFIAGRVLYQTVQASLVTRSCGLEAENKRVTFVKAAESLPGEEENDQLWKQLGVAFTSSVGINGHIERRASELSNNLLHQKEKKRHCHTQTNLNTAPKPQRGNEEGKELWALEKVIARLPANPNPGRRSPGSPSR